ncbi:MAG: hypothetical protein IKQ94_04900 [Bacteroidales bacterium]|nr:hypothetical protein [Bacteroidales bacterium]MBR4198096.1 hypothetical protein [Bacteroidales bacterium]
MTNIDITGIVISVVLVGVVLLGALFFKKRSAQSRQSADKSDNKGCSIAFYVFLALIIVTWIVAYILYRWHFSGS